jgi:hypothetical protein
MTLMSIKKLIRHSSLAVYKLNVQPDHALSQTDFSPVNELVRPDGQKSVLVKPLQRDKKSMAGSQCISFRSESAV